MRVELCILLVFVSINVFAQDSNELDQRNGFKDIKLLSNVADYNGLEYWKAQKNKEEHSIYKSTNGSYDKIGEVPISKLLVYTYRNLTYQIEVIVDKDEQLFRSLEKAYGKIKYSVGSQVSYWEGVNVKLTYEPLGKSKLKLTYTAKGINNIIATDKKKAIDSLSSEF